MDRLKKLIRLSFPVGLGALIIWLLLGYMENIARNAHQNNIDYIYGKTYDKVVRVENPADWRQHGTGFLIAGKSGQKFIMTNAHVCRSRDFANIRNNFFNFQAKVVYSDPVSDICLYDTPKDLKYIPLQLTETQPYINDLVYSLGYPGHLKLMLSEGILSNFTADFMDEPYTGQTYCHFIMAKNNQTFCTVKRDFWISTMHVIPGQSGSPVLNLNGEVVGMVFVNLGNGLYSGFIFLEEIQKVLNKY